MILWHCYFLPGRDVPFAPTRRLFGAIWVDGFFAISGFLITASWLGKPRVRDYFVARGLRILPGFYTCLLVIAFVVAPIGVTIQGGSAAKLLVSSAPIEYILKNSAMWMFQYDFGGTPRGIPRHAWNVSLWTLGWELFCYTGVAVVGVVGLLSRRWFLSVAMALVRQFAYAAAWQHSWGRLDTFTAATLKPKPPNSNSRRRPPACTVMEPAATSRTRFRPAYTVTPPRPPSPPALNELLKDLAFEASTR